MEVDANATDESDYPNTYPKLRDSSAALDDDRLCVDDMAKAFEQRRRHHPNANANNLESIATPHQPFR